MTTNDRLAESWLALRARLLVIAALCCIMIVAHLLSWIIWPIRGLGIHPRDVGSAWMIATAPFVHADWGHLANNLVSFAVMGLICLRHGVRHFTLASLIIIVLGGGLVWLIGRSASHIGASGWIFGLWSLAIVEAWFDRSPRTIAISFAVLVFYGGMAWGVLPVQPGVSFESHLFGTLAGVVAAYALHRRTPQAVPPISAGPKFWA